MTQNDIDAIITILCPSDEDFEKQIISPAYLKKELEALALEQEPCDRLKLDGMLEDAYEHGYQQARYDYETEPCEDCVSREAVLNALHVEGRPTKRFEYAIDVRRDIEALPPVTPKPRTGKWVNDKNLYKCTACNDLCTVAGYVSCIPKEQMYKVFKHCPNCGCKMTEGEQNES